MAKVKMGKGGVALIDSQPKNTRQGMGRNTKFAATSRNNAKKKYRGQGR